MKKHIALLTLATLACAPLLHAADPGKPAPDFTLTDSNGKSHSLADYKGKFVVLEWINHDCPFVVKHYNSGNMQKLQREYTAKNVVWLTICSSAEGKQGHLSPEGWNKITADKKAQPSAVLLDEDGKTGKAYNAKTTPHMYIINPEGALIYAGAIDSIKSVDIADIDKAENYVKSALDAALAGETVKTPTSTAYGCSVKY